MGRGRNNGGEKIKLTPIRGTDDREMFVCFTHDGSDTKVSEFHISTLCEENIRSLGKTCEKRGEKRGKKQQPTNKP